VGRCRKLLTDQLRYRRFQDFIVRMRKMLTL
jgi:hypothetical protein